MPLIGLAQDEKTVATGNPINPRHFQPEARPRTIHAPNEELTREPIEIPAPTEANQITHANRNARRNLDGLDNGETHH
jgi:hypothetical protein